MVASVPEWITAFGTVAAAVVALFVAIGLQWWQARSARDRVPVLSLEKDESSWLSTSMGWSKCRLTVENHPGKAAAHDVLVSVERIREGGGDRHLFPLNMTLPWSQFFGEAGLRPMTIPAGARRHVDLGEFVEDHDPKAIDGPSFSVAKRTGAIGNLQLSPCRFELTVSAENCDASEWHVELRFEHRDDHRKKPENVQLSVQRAT